MAEMLYVVTCRKNGRRHFAAPEPMTLEEANKLAARINKGLVKGQTDALVSPSRKGAAR